MNYIYYFSFLKRVTLGKEKTIFNFSFSKRVKG